MTLTEFKIYFTSTITSKRFVDVMKSNRSRVHCTESSQDPDCEIRIEREISKPQSGFPLSWDGARIDEDNFSSQSVFLLQSTNGGAIAVFAFNVISLYLEE